MLVLSKTETELMSGFKNNRVADNNRIVEKANN